MQSQFSKGKLCCERCEGRVGAFDFLSVIRCVCGKHNIPPIRVAKNRVDLCVPPQLPPVSDISRSNQDRSDAATMHISHANSQRDGVRGLPLHADNTDGWTTSGREMDAILQSGLSNNSLQSEGSRTRRIHGSGTRSHNHRKVRSNRPDVDDSVITGDTDSDSGIQSRPASDSESEGSQQVQGNSDNNDRLRPPKNVSSNRFQELQESSDKQENVSLEILLVSIYIFSS